MANLEEILSEWKLDPLTEEEIKMTVGEDWEEGKIERYIIGVLLKRAKRGLNA
ncbi:hypothetical protein H5T88_00970 [bacterium]|nr:hypothetical protein [bacterium]